MEEQKLDSDRRQEQLTWLENLQRNSWEPEVIISGITLAFLFAFPSKIYEVCAYLNQEVGIGFAFSILLVFYLTSIISVFKIFFVVHLSLRFIWTGLLGLSYAFPQGAINEKLFKIGQSYNYQKPSDMVLRLEKICSMTFAYPISLMIIFLATTVYLSLFIALYVWLDLSFLVVYLAFMGSLLVFGGMALVKSKLLTWYGQSMISSINAIYQSNLGKWFSIGYSICIFALAIPVILSDIQGFSLFLNEVELSKSEQEWPAKNQHYMDQHEPDKRFPRAFINSEEIADNFLRVGIARYEDDQKVIQDLNQEFKMTLDTLGWKKIEIPADLHRVYINDSLIQIDQWAKNKLAVSSQKVFQAGIDISNLKYGIHGIRIEKLLLVYGFSDNEPKVRLLENWSVFTFVKK